MRVIAGSAKGTKLRAPEGVASRPVLDRVKESWFASIAGRLEGARSLDLYAGAGSVGIEALSRGAASCTFVERDRDCVRFLGENLARARLTGKAVVRCAEIELAVWDLVRAGERYELVFVDPPFADTDRPDYLTSDPVFRRLRELAAGGGLVMLRRQSAPPRGGTAAECRRKRRSKRDGNRRGPEAEAPPAPAGLRLLRSRSWGRSEVLFYERPAAGDGPESLRRAADTAGG
jgi:16S rRNA (guanine(966)-N(2))-methyltransferase RsmD